MTGRTDLHRHQQQGKRAIGHLQRIYLSRGSFLVAQSRCHAGCWRPHPLVRSRSNKAGKEAVALCCVDLE